MIGKSVDPYDDMTTIDLEDVGWTGLPCVCLINEEKIDWMRENFTNVDTEVRWLETIRICFRRADEAMAFKLRWL